MQVRLANESDLDRLCALAADYAVAEGATLARDRVREAFSALLVNDRYGRVLVAEDRQILGYAVLTWGYGIESGGIEALLDEVYVSQPGTGIGTELVRAALSAAREHGARTMFLETERGNDGARRFYARFDFTVEDSIWMRREL